VSDTREVLDAAKTAAQQLFAAGLSPDVLAGLVMLLVEGMPPSHRVAVLEALFQLHCTVVAMPVRGVDTIH